MALTPAEWSACYESWRKNEEAAHRDRWERARLMAFSAVVPHSKKIRKAEDYIRFPWEMEAEAAEVPKLTKEERRRRMEELSSRWNNH
jgi:hypothetical protein